MSRDLELCDDDIDGKFLWACWLQLAGRMVSVTFDLRKYSRLLPGVFTHSYIPAYTRQMRKNVIEAACDYRFILSSVQLCLSIQLAS